MSKKYVNIEHIDPERIPCYYGANCRIEDVEEWIAELPVEEGLEKVTHCKECVFSDKKTDGKCVCRKTGIMHKDSYYCADGLSPDNLPYWKTIYNEPGNDNEKAKFKCPHCRNIYLEPFPKCPCCHNQLRIPKPKEK